ncbi:cellulose binding domain-containing protein [Micromonospora sp. KLBMP9576]|uniref:cellulose binding domain-containing protein n=1 Tax=Micromonospora sp. KLBMP9576 TaxID=3424769 RepID=UPI003D8B37C5
MPGTRHGSRTSYGTTVISSSPWIVVSVGVVVMVVLLAIALGSYRGRGPSYEARPGPPLPTIGLAEPEPSATSPTATRSPQPAATPSRRATGRPTPQRSTPGRASEPPSATPARSPDAALIAPPPAPATTVTGRYRLVESHAAGFVGELLVSNSSTASLDWAARLTFADGRLVTAWVEGAAQGTARRIDDGFTYHSGQDLPGGASATLRFYVEGGQGRPTNCTVDGGACRL